MRHDDFATTGEMGNGKPSRETNEGPERIATYHAVYLRGAIIASCARSDANNPYYCESARACCYLEYLPNSQYLKTLRSPLRTN